MLRKKRVFMLDYIIIGLCALTLIISVFALIKISKKGATGGDLTVEYLHEIEKQLSAAKEEIAITTRAANSALNDAFNVNFKMLSHSLAELTRAEQESGKQVNEQTRLFLNSLKADIEKRLFEMSENNNRKIEEIRKTVDEKLAESLENRVKLAFSGINARLTDMQKNFDEVQRLSSQVTKLNGVFTNVKNRGTWGEITLENILSEILPADTYMKQCRIGESREFVDFAIKMPASGEELLLPIDCKFPIADYERLTEAYDQVSREEVVFARKRLLIAVKEQAKSICAKYIYPPRTTNFAIMYLPTEGLFAEVAREAGFLDELRVKHKIIPCGPTTISALLNSLLVGFTTLKIQKKSAEVVGMIKEFSKDFDKFTDLIEKIRRNSEGINTALDGLDKRSELIKKKLGRLDLNAIESDEGQMSMIEENAE